MKRFTLELNNYYNLVMLQVILPNHFNIFGVATKSISVVNYVPKDDLFIGLHDSKALFFHFSTDSLKTSCE